MLKKKINSRQKGARGERELATFLSEKGFEARRGQQFKGTSDSPDVECQTLSRWHIECKRVEKLNLLKAFKKCEEECSLTQRPVVMHRQNTTPWLVTITLDDFLLMETLLQKSQDQTERAFDRNDRLLDKNDELLDRLHNASSS